LFTSEELSRNFEWIFSDMQDPTLRAVLYQSGSGPRTNNIEIWHMGDADMSPEEREWFEMRMVPMQNSYSVDLEDGYALWVYTIR